MCGIAGVFSTAGTSTINQSLVEAMTTSLTHRGPDEHGYFFDNGVGLGHRRLSIIDISSGQQPMRSEDGNFVLTFNGEIYNFRELRKELLALGDHFDTDSDTEVLLKAWIRWGSDCVNRLNGMFAFAILNRGSRELFLVRDQIGIKPLFYSVLPNGDLVFGSELKALLEVPELGKRLDPRSVEDFFTFGYVPDPRTILENTFKLPPAHFLRLKYGEKPGEPKKYWDVEFARQSQAVGSDPESELLERIKGSVAAQMVADVPLGAFLSGGVDSSAVVASMAQVSDNPISTCAIGFSEGEYDESRYAKKVAERFSTNHVSRIVEPNDFGLVDALSGLYDEPYADSSAMPTYRVCELARENVTVALSGDGGDETFAGYRRYKWHMQEESIRSRIPSAIRRNIFGPLGRFYPKLDWAPQIFRAKTTFESLAMASAEAYLHSVSIFPATLRKTLFSDSMSKDLQGYRSLEVFANHAKNGPDHALSLVQYIDFHTYLPGDILTKVDRASMAHSLEVRVPLLDHELVSWAAGLPPDLKLKGSEGKFVLKKAFEGLLPNDILYRRKMGFAVPLQNWFRGPLSEQVRSAVLGSRLAETNLFDTAQLRRIVDDHQSGMKNYTGVLWALLMFDRFVQGVLDR